MEDIHEALVGAVPGIRFGLAFCEASGKRLVRWSGNDEAALALARDNALAIGAGHTFLIFLGDGFFPVNVLAAVRAVPEVCHIYCATANPTQVIVAQTEQGRGVLGVVDGTSPLGVETDADIAWRKDLLRERSATSCSGWMKPRRSSGSSRRNPESGHMPARDRMVNMGVVDRRCITDNRR